MCNHNQEDDTITKREPVTIDSILDGDATDWIRLLSTESVQLVIADPPWLVTDFEFDKKFDSYGWIDEVQRIMTPNGYLVLFGAIETLAKVQGFDLRFWCVWRKPRPLLAFHNQKKPGNQCEAFGVYTKKGVQTKDLFFQHVYTYGEPYKKVQKLVSYIRGGKDMIDRGSTSHWTKDGYVSENDGTRIQSNVIDASFKPCMKKIERTKHPTQKPLKLMATIIMWLTQKGDLVLDPFCGSGSSCVAASRFGRHYIGIDNDSVWCKVARQRLVDVSVFDKCYGDLIFDD